MMSIQVRREGAVEYVALNRPDVRNAFNAELIAELTRWAQTAGRDRDLRVAVLSGAGKVFCAGADVGWLSNTIAYTQEDNVSDATALARMFEALDSLPFALVGRIHGAALGGGVGLVAVCDVAVAAEDTLFGFTEVKLGIVPATISPYAVAKIGVSAARELFLSGRRFSAARAREIGLLHTVVPAQELDRAVGAHVRELLSSGPRAVATAKTLVSKVAARAPAEVAAMTADTIARARVSEEGQEGLKAFLEKRKPHWAEDSG